jgi:hypothetical protein
MGKPLPLTLLRVINPCHLHDRNGMSLPDDTDDTRGHFATGSIYGLPQAPRASNKRLTDDLKLSGFQPLINAETVFL